ASPLHVRRRAPDGGVLLPALLSAARSRRARPVRLAADLRDRRALLDDALPAPEQRHGAGAHLGLRRAHGAGLVALPVRLERRAADHPARLAGLLCEPGRDTRRAARSAWLRLLRPGPRRAGRRSHSRERGEEAPPDPDPHAAGDREPDLAAPLRPGGARRDGQSLLPEP